MAGGFGGSIKLTGESEYRKALKQITDNLTLLSSEMKVVTSQYDKADTSTENLTAQNAVLNKRLDEQNKKLAEAKKMLDEAKNSTDSNATTVAKWQNEVNRAQAEVNKTTTEIKKNTEIIAKNEGALDDAGDELDDFTKGEEKAGQGAIQMGDLIKANIISEAIIGGVKKLASAMVSLAKGAFDLGKQSIESFAEYEQLIGGVETLFKDSAGTVQDYANNAYKTAGLGANEYMSTVTAFSASLLQSLNGDTAKAAEVANMAITDMSDNANKMGTSMESVQAAYQGFAKGQYQLLDNLKLGYGGTKTEMERLLQDATAISGVKYDISNLNDVYQAIHVIQGELGITGTTAKEASTTIEGSVSAMKSAWQNLLTGLADDNANFSELVSNFVDSILIAADNILPRVQTVIQGLGMLVSGLVSELLPEIISQIPPMIETMLPILLDSVNTAISSIVGALPQILTALQDLAPLILNTLLGMLPSVLDAGIQIVLSLASSIGNSLPTLIPVAVSAILTVVDNLISNIDLLVDAGISLILGLAEGLIAALPDVLAKIPVIIEKVLYALYANEGKLLKAGADLLVSLGQGLIKAIPQIVLQVPQIIKSIISGLLKGIPELIKCGGEMLAGLFKGFLDPKAIWNACVSVFNGILDGLKSLFKINSPSVVMKDQLGKNLALGVGVGFEDTMSSVTEQMADAIPTNFDIGATVKTSNATAGTALLFSDIVAAFKEALSQVNIVLDDEVAGRFVTDTVARVVYS